MKKYEITYEYLPEPTPETGWMEVEAETEEEALQIFEETCEDEVLSVRRTTCLGYEVDPNQMSFVEAK